MDRNNHYVVAQGRVAEVQNAFQVQINRFKVNGEISVLGYETYVRRPMNPETGAPYRGIPLVSAGSNGSFFNADCFRPPQTVTFTTPGGGPSATYHGNRFGADINSPPPILPPCGYNALEIETAYGLGDIYRKGFKGHNQTIVIVDAFGSNTILEDTNEFSKLNHLPLLTTKNFQIFKPNGTARCTNACIAGNWQFETTLDVEWAHSIAPDANIALVLGADNSFANLDIANLFAIENGLGNVISNSFGIPEIVLVDLQPSTLTIENNIAQTAAALGISLNTATGDAGDSLVVDNLNFGIDSTSPGFASTSPFETGVGGTSLFLKRDNTIRFQTGWGNRISQGSTPVVPPRKLGFIFGADGGESTVFPKPAFQKNLPGSFRQTPDISMIADPETGVEIVVTPDSVPGHPQSIDVFGGTSLSCPMFSALWALANEAAGGGPIGEAAPLLYELPAGAITDIRQIGSPNNVTGTITIPNTPPAPPTIIHESAAALAAPLENTTSFVSALYNSLTFGTDSSLTTGPGWDNVTGLGTPKGLEFINAVVTAAGPQ